MTARAVAKYLAVVVDDLSITTGSTNLFVNRMPDQPDEAVAVMDAGGFPQPTLAPTDLPSVQVLVRGTRNAPSGGLDTATAIYSALACLDGVTLDEGGTDEVHVIGCTPAQSSPVPLGPDTNGRTEWSLNFNLRVHNPTTHRPANTP